MIKTREFLAIVKGAAKTDAQPSGGSSVLVFAKIDPGYTTGQPKLIFEPETSVSGRTYPVHGSYTPVAGDRVLVALVNGSGVVLGKFA